MTKGYTYFERNYLTFWGKIAVKKDKMEMANEIRIRFMRVAGILSAIYGEDIVGYWAKQFAVLADDIERSKEKKIKMSDKTPEECISVFRTLANKGYAYTRPPEDQSCLFNSKGWEEYKNV